MSLRSASASPTRMAALQEQIDNAILNKNLQLHERFVPRRKLSNILSLKELVELYEELFDTSTSKEMLEAYARKTLEAPSRIAILALFLHLRKTNCIKVFKQWLQGETQEAAHLPSDEDIPLSLEKTKELFHQDEAQCICDYQGVFKPLIIRKNKHEELPVLKCRMPFVNSSKEIGHGASGTVFEVTIAAGQCQYNKYNEWQFSNNPVKLAMKVFKKEGGDTSAESATQNFKDERDFLKQLKDDNKRHKMILLDHGSITTIDDQGSVTHMLFFELAVYNLDRFFESDEYATREKSVIISKAVDILGALDFLHKIFKSFHLDIKPDNILVFVNEKYKDGFCWKLTDFNLSRNKIKRSAKPLPHYIKNDESNESTIPSPRGEGLYQAPEIQNRMTSQASEGSDIWSMGGILLTMLAFLHDAGPQGVKELQKECTVHTIGHGVERNHFYVTDDMHDGGPALPLAYLDNLSPAIEQIEIDPTHTKINAQVHPGVLKWSRILFANIERASKPESYCARTALEIIFKDVLVINRKQRIKASELERKFAEVRDSYKHLEVFGAIAVQPPATRHSQFCEAIAKSNYPEIKRLVVQSSENPNEACAHCSLYPIHQILRNNDCKFLKALLSSRDKIEINVQCPQSFQTPLKIACEGSIEYDFILQLCEYSKCSVEISKEWYKERKGRLPKNARKLLEMKLRDTKNA